MEKDKALAKGKILMLWQRSDGHDTVQGSLVRLAGGQHGYSRDGGRVGEGSGEKASMSGAVISEKEG